MPTGTSDILVRTTKLTMEGDEQLPTPQYSLLKELGDGRFLVRRIRDGETLLAEEMPPDSHYEQISRNSAESSATALLNHENLISPHGLVKNLVVYGSSGAVPGPYDGREGGVPECMIVWDYCDAGTLEDVFESPPVKITATGYFPESFVWHVALGVLRALQWLHEGVRDTYDVRKDTRSGRGCVRIRETTEPEKDWMPILHRSVFPQNIFLQQPRGVETYGQVKLGNFSRCLVLGQASERTIAGEHPPVLGVQSLSDPSLEELKEAWLSWRWSLHGEGSEGLREAEKKIAPDKRPFTRGSDMFDLGTILFRLMKGSAIPGKPGYLSGQGQECLRCGCNHLTCNHDRGYKPCPHACWSDLNIDEALEPLTDYSGKLRVLVGQMLKMKWESVWRTSDWMHNAWVGFEDWAENWGDGRLYRDLYDDMLWRQQNAEKKQQVMYSVAKETGALKSEDLGVITL
ncbi:hypothetical protein B0H67DRAFT_648231 [Lasiosphaeris hirsuta]|uniref:non-specific serine/threonine protein kinase n=1 Tax=Lasiosphaeris hirsuta TaxID=260670 RepID=A0AA40A2K8_9PEZI|nr:hypothetical protein B0H67DRAFT_648231 [Lasiosphaeris hirsuta]